MRIIELFTTFAQVLTKPTYKNLAVLLRGAVLANGARTVTGCLKAAWPWVGKHFSAFENVLRRARMNQLRLARLMLELIISGIPEGDVVEFIVDETVVRRYGPYVSGVSMHRDKLYSSHSHCRMTPGNMWIVLAVALRFPFLENVVALPILSVNYVSPNKGRSKSPRRSRHRTPCDLALLMVRIASRWMEGRRFRLIGDAWYGSHLMADLLNDKSEVCPDGSLVSRFQWDARLHDEPGKYSGRGRPKIVGDQIPNPLKEAESDDAEWVAVEVRWYRNELRKVTLLSGEGLWYRCGQGATWVRWVIVRDPLGKRQQEIFFTTDRSLSPAGIVECYVRRWSIEVTFEETRRHLGIEGLRNRTANAVNRSVPLLLSLYSFIIVWFSSSRYLNTGRSLSTPWYKKKSLTFSNLIDYAREDILSEFLLLQDSDLTSEFLLAPFPLNIVYYLTSKRKKVA